MEIESKLIYFFGTIYEGGRKGTLLNLDLSKRPNFIGAMHHFVTKKVQRKIDQFNNELIEVENEYSVI